MSTSGFVVSIARGGYKTMNADSMEIELMRKKWLEDYTKLEKERNDFVNYFEKNKKCKCKIESCRHLKKTEVMLEFQHKAWDLHIRHMNMGLRTLMTIIPESFNKTQVK